MGGEIVVSMFPGRRFVAGSTPDGAVVVKAKVVFVAAVPSNYVTDADGTCDLSRVLYVRTYRAGVVGELDVLRERFVARARALLQ